MLLHMALFLKAPSFSMVIRRNVFPILSVVGSELLIRKLLTFKKSSNQRTAHREVSGHVTAH